MMLFLLMVFLGGTHSIVLNNATIFWARWERFPSSFTSNYGNWGDQGIFSSTSYPGGRRDHGICIFPNSRSIYAFGGRGYTDSTSSIILDDFWEYNIDLKQWKFIRGNSDKIHGNYVDQGVFSSSAYPGGRYHFGMSCIDSIDNEGKIILLTGGIGYGTETANDGGIEDMWMYSFDKDQYKWISGTGAYDVLHTLTQQGVWGGASIGSISGLLQLNFAQKQSIMLFGGPTWANHAFLYNYTTHETKWFFGTAWPFYATYASIGYDSGNIIGGRETHCGWKISDDEFFVFGGYGFYDASAGMLSDLWFYSFEINEWGYKGKGANANPLSRHGLIDRADMGGLSNVGGTFVNGMIFIFGGSAMIDSTGYLYVYSIVQDQWFFLHGEHKDYTFGAYEKKEYSTANIVGSRFSPALFSFDDEFGNEEVYIFGGYGNSDRSSDYQNDMVALRDIHTCYGVLESSSNVCNGYGKCVKDNMCVCNEHFYGHNCEISTCGGYISNSTSACGGKGFCIDAECQCVPTFTGEYCEIPICYGTMGNDQNVCSGNGECTNNIECICWIGWYGNICGERNIFFSVFVDYWYIFGIIFAIISFIVIILLAGLIIAIGVFLRQKNRLKKFEVIEDIDVLLEEQKHSKDLSIAHLKINKKLFEIDFEKDVKMKARIGSGGSSNDVFLVEWKGQQAAFKCFRSAGLTQSQESFEEFEKEVEILASVSHPNILRFFGAVLSSNRVGYLMEYAKKGDLNSFLLKFHQNVGFQYPISEKIRILLEIVNGMFHLHSLNIIHRDLKPKNVVMMEKTLTAKIMDFGISKIVRNNTDVKTRRIGTSYYMAPEVFNSTKYDEKCDVFSYGILMFTIFTEKFTEPYGSYSGSIDMKVSNDPSFRPTIDNESFHRVPKWIISLMKECWKHSPYERPSFEKVLNEMRTFASNGNEKNDNFKETLMRDIEIERNKIVTLKEKLKDKRKRQSNSKNHGPMKNSQVPTKPRVPVKTPKRPLSNRKPPGRPISSKRPMKPKKPPGRPMSNRRPRKPNAPPRTGYKSYSRL